MTTEERMEEGEMTILDEIKSREKRFVSAEFSIVDQIVGCAMALKCLHMVDGNCEDQECTICQMLRAIGTDLSAGKYDADKDRTFLLAEIKRLRSLRHGWQRQRRR